jgi:hypothetical protein
MLFEKLVDTPVRGVVYEAAGPLDAEVYARGRVSHRDHKTVVLAGWHRVLMNTEAGAPGAPSVTFLD